MVDPPRQTRQRTTRSNHEFSLEQHPSVPRLRSRSRSRMGSSPLSSLSPSPTKLAHRLPIITTTTGEASNSVAVPQIVPITQAPTRTHTKAAPVRPSRDKGKGKAVPIQGQLPAEAKPGKRVLPARIRRAAGGGQEGFRDLEDIIVDWLTRYGYPDKDPPGNLRISITSLPLDMVDPPVTFTQKGNPSAISEEEEAGPSRHQDRARVMIETPDWIKVPAGQDDEEEAKDELLAGSSTSPVRRLRRLSPMTEHAEDVSDEYYHRLHRKYEVIEKRQRKDERDKITFERYKMRTRIDLLKTISTPSWSSVVWTVLAREDTTGHWDKGKNAVRTNGIQWLRRRLIKEGEEVIRRYDKMLPVDPRKSKVKNEQRTAIESESPPPGLPARVAALKTLKEAAANRRKSLPVESSSSVPASSSPRKRRKSEHAKQSQSPTRKSSRNIKQTAELFDSDSDLSDLPSDLDPDSDSDVELLESFPSSSPSPAVVAPSPASSDLSHISVTASPVPQIWPQSSQSTSRSQPRPALPPTRSSARMRSSGVPAPSSPTSPAPRIELETDVEMMMMEESHWRVCDPVKQDLPTTANTFQVQMEDEITLDEQLELERVEAAVVI